MDIKKTLKYTSLSLIAVAALAGLGFHIYARVQDSKPLPKFSFDASKASGWTGSENVNVQDVAKTTAYNGKEPIENLPVADLTVHHGTPSKIPEDNCFVMYSYFKRPLGDPAAAYKDYVGRKTSNGKVDELGSVEQTLSTSQDDITYQLKQYRYVIEGQDALQGYEVGFAPLETGHVRIEGVCKTADDLALTLPILSSVRLLER